jgi:hypothetical protein
MQFACPKFYLWRIIACVVLACSISRALYALATVVPKMIFLQSHSISEKLLAVVLGPALFAFQTTSSLDFPVLNEKAEMQTNLYSVILPVIAALPAWSSGPVRFHK